MAEEFDYLEDSEYGKVATSILDRSKKKSGFFQSGNLIGLFADVAAKYIDKKNRDLQSEQAKNIDRLTKQYNNVIGTRKDYFNSSAIKKQREDYQLWNNPETKEKARLTKAIEYFNQDKDMIKELGINPYKAYTELPKNSENTKIMAEALELLKGQADIYFESITDDALVVPTQAEYLKEVKDAYEAALAEAENDPTKKTFIRKQFLKAFGRDEKGNPRFGLINQDKLKNLRINAERSAGISRDNALQIVSDLDIQQRAVEEKEALERPDLSGFDFINEKPKTSKPNAQDARVLMDAYKDARNYFNKDYTFKITDNDGNEKELPFSSVYQGIDNYNGNDSMQGQYDKTSLVYDILTVSKSLRTDFEKTNTTGQVRSAEAFLIPAVQKVFDRLSNGLPSMGFENILQVIEPNTQIYFNSGGKRKMLKYFELEEIFNKIGDSEKIQEWIDNADYDKEYDFAFEVLKRKYSK